jgi:hypothetical protein
MESEAELYVFDSTHFLCANRQPSSGQARGHASLENALAMSSVVRFSVCVPLLKMLESITF